MKSVRYGTGEAAKVGDVVALSGQRGRITVVGEALMEWGLSKEEIEEGRLMIEFDNGALVCTDAGSEDLLLITPAT